MAALKIFTVAYLGIRLKVRVLPCIADVHREYTAGKRLRNGTLIHAFFAPMSSPAAQFTGTVVLPIDGKLAELIPHEVTHAVLHKCRVAVASDDEGFATAVGVLSARIARKIEAMA